MSRLADLAQANLIAIGERRPDVGFDVRHIEDLPGYLHDLLSGDSQSLFADDGEEPGLLQTLSSASYGVGIVLGTRAGKNPVDEEHRISRGLEPQIEVAQSASGRREFIGTALPNPTFLYEGRAGLEGLVVIDSRPSIPTDRHCIRTREVVRIVSDVAYRKLRAAILSIQAPVQVPLRTYSESHTSHTEDRWTRSYGTAVRFTIAAGSLTAAERNSALAELLSYCDDNGFGLALLDPRPSHRSGNWFWLSESTNEQDASGAHPGTGQQIYSAYTLTAVGPARVGSTAAIMACLSEIADLCLLSCSITALSDLAFISLSVGLTYQQHLETTRNRDRWLALRSVPNVTVDSSLTEILKNIGFRRTMSVQSLALLRKLAGDYAICHGPLVRLNFNSSHTSRPIWFSVEARNAETGLKTSVASLYKAMAVLLDPAVKDLGERLGDGRRVAVPNVDYLIARATSVGGLRVRGKISIPDVVLDALMPHTSYEQRATYLAQTLEDDWAEGLAASGQNYNVSVAWRENWLGHWSARSTETGRS